jgi:hypothetical protein
MPTPSEPTSNTCVDLAIRFESRGRGEVVGPCSSPAMGRRGPAHMVAPLQARPFHVQIGDLVGGGIRRFSMRSRRRQASPKPRNGRRMWRWGPDRCRFGSTCHTYLICDFHGLGFIRGRGSAWVLKHTSSRVRFGRPVESGLTPPFCSNNLKNIRVVFDDSGSGAGTFGAADIDWRGYGVVRSRESRGGSSALTGARRRRRRASL